MLFVLLAGIIFNNFREIRERSSMSNTIPFGLRFAESPSRDSKLETRQPFYDHEAGLSYVLSDNGERQPFVLWAWNFAGDTRTGTTTKASGDSEDTDVVQTPRTQTVTEARENMDTDY